MIKYLLPFVFVIITCNIQAQDKTIHFEKRSNRPFVVDNKTYSFKERNQIFKNEEALKLLSSSHSKFIGSQILSGIGGGFLGFTVADLLLAKKEKFTEEQWKNKKKARTILLGSSVALIAVAIPIAKSGLRKTIEAVDLENQTNSSLANRMSLKIQGNTNGLSLVMNF